MNYGGNMPDWHQYNASQTNEVTPPTQNVNSGHLAFIPGVSSPTLNALNLNSEGLNKHQNDANYNPRNFQSYNNVSGGPNIPNNNPLASMVQMQNCIGHYSSPNTRNPILDNINASVDPRNATIANINDDIGYRSNQVPFNGPIGHLNGANCNLNATSGPGSGPGSVPGPRANSGQVLGTNPGSGTGPGSIYAPGTRHGPQPGHGSSSGLGNLGPRNANIGSVPTAGKTGPPPPSFIPCKGLCCNSDPNINYQQWEKFGSYQNNASYRDNVHPSGYQMENRHFGNNCNYRKDNLEGKDVMGGPVLPNATAVDQRRNYADYKYHKDHLVHRNYPASSGMFHNYPIQNYNYSTEHQKYPYPVKEQAKTNNMNMANSGMLKHQESNYIAQQKYNNKQFQYQNGNMLAKGVPALNVNTNMTTSPQNPYFNSQYQRNVPAEISHECQESTDNTGMVNRMQGNFMHSSPSQHQVYQHKIAMQKFSMENHLRELSRIPGYQSHPKYKECVLRYREVLKLQQSSSYQNPVQQTPRVATPVNSAVPPINLQFDQNGMLINSTYIPDSFPKMQHPPTVEQTQDSLDKQKKDQAIGLVNEKCQQSQRAEQLMIPQQNEHVPSSCAETTFQKQNQFSMRKDFNQNQLKVQTSESHSFDISSNPSNEAMMQQKVSKEFANKPDLDVRQFLANWDETDDEEGTMNLEDTVLNETTPVVVVSYENVDVSSKTPPETETSRRSNFCPSESIENEKKSEVIAAQSLAISYSSPDNPEIAKTSKRTIGEGVMKPGSIIHCISNGPDEIPTIHIVDNLEISNILGASNDQVIQTLEKQKTISFFKESGNNEEEESMALENAEEQSKNKTSSVLPANYGASLNDGNKDASMEDSETIQAAAISMNSQELRKGNMDVSDNMELKKQHSFEESHNPDDISLPDLPTSECTPISTTLNTPIHSDSEESSQNMEDLSISTNPIEVMQNSPVISFTQLNSEEKGNNRSLGTLELEFQKENRFKSTEAQNGHEQDVTLDNFDFCDNSKAKSGETAKSKQAKSLGTNTARRKSDSRVSDTCGVLTSMEYELEASQEAVEGEKNSDRGSPGCTQEGKLKSGGRSSETMRSGIQSGDAMSNIASNENLSPGESDEEKSERDLFKRKKIKTSTVSTNTSSLDPSEGDANGRKKAKEGATWEAKDRNFSQRRDAADSRQSKSSDGRKFGDSSSSQSGEHSVCHMTSQHKHYSVAVIKDNVTLSGKRSHGTTDRASGGFSSKSSSANTKELCEETEVKKRASSKVLSMLHETIHAQTTKLLQKDLKTVDGDVRYTAEEIRLLKEYRKKEKLHQSVDTHNNNRDEKIKSRRHSLKNVEEESQKVSSNSERSEAQEESKGHYAKSLVKNADFGIQVANVNLKIKDSDAGKELILGEKKGQEHAKDSLEGIKIEINVSCTERNSKGQEQNKRLLYDDRNLYEMDDSLSYSNTLNNQRRSHAKDREDASKLSEKARRASEKSDAEMNGGKNNAETTNSSATLKKGGRRGSLGGNEEIRSMVSKETSDGQLFSKSLCKNVSSRDSGKPEVIEATNYAADKTDIIKSKSVISNTAIVDANNKIKGKNKAEREKEENCARIEEDRMLRVQKQSSTSLIDVSGVIENEIASMGHLKSSKKLPESSLVELNAKSFSTFSALDFNFDKLEYKKSSGINLERGHRLSEDLDEGEYAGKWKKPKIDDIFEDCDMFQSSSGYVNPIFSSIDKLEDLHTVPVYTTKDGKISYSPNRRFTYHELMIETRKREASCSARKSHYANTFDSYYNSKFRKLYKKKRHHGLSERKKYDYNDTKYLYDRKRNYSDEFCGRSHTKYKDYSNTAVWSDHCKLDKIYSSSDSDEEIIDRNKNRVIEATICKRNQATESTAGTISKLNQNEVAIDELNVESKSKETSNSVDEVLDKSNEINWGGTQTVASENPNANKEENKDCETENNSNLKDSVALNEEQSDAPSISLQSNQEKENAEIEETKKEKVEALPSDNLELVPENLRADENKNCNAESTNVSINEVEDKVSSEPEETASLKEESPISKLLNEESVVEDKQESSLCNSEEKKENNEEIILEQTEVNKEHKEIIDAQASSDNQTSSQEVKSNSEDVQKVETNEDLQTDQINVPESKIEAADEISEPQANSSHITKEVAQESLEPEIADNISDQILEKSEKSTNLENISEHKVEDIQLNEKGTSLKVASEEEKHEETRNEEIGRSVALLEHPNDDILPKDASLVNQEEPGSQTMQVDAKIDHQNSSEHVSVETAECEATNFDQVDNKSAEVQNFDGFIEEEIASEVENITENVDLEQFNKDKTEIVLKNADEISEEVKTTVTDTLETANVLDTLPSVSEQEINVIRDSSIEKEVPVLSKLCAAKNPPIIDAESVKDDAEDAEKKEKQCQCSKQVPCKSSTHTLDSNMTDVKAIPKLVIKKSDAITSKAECSDYVNSCEGYNKCDAKLLSEARPKIPKMIIMKSRSRSVTPTIEILEKSKSVSDKTQAQFLPEQNEDGHMDTENSDSESYTLKYKNYESKVPKVKIKLEDISSKDLKLYLKRKATKKSVPKVKIKKLKTVESKRVEAEDSSGMEAMESDEEEDKTLEESMVSDAEVERIPKLKLKRQEEGNSLSPESSRGKDSNVINKVASKRTQRTKEEDIKHSTKCDNNAAIDDELRKKFPRCIIEKIPKVIIKRTQIGAEFKCEISKSRKKYVAENSKWQPKVKLQRLEALDHMVKDLKQSRIALKDKLSSPARVSEDINDISEEDTLHDSKLKLCRSNSASSLSPIKCKQRRLSDSGYAKAGLKSAAEFEDDLEDSDKVASSKSDNVESKNVKRKGRKRLFSENKQATNQGQDEESEDEVEAKHSFRNILTNEKDNDLMVVKKEYSCFGTKESTPPIEDKFLNSATRLRIYEDNENSIIKVDTSDESQTTIEILPASPNSSEDEGKNGEFENASGINMEDAIPTQLELELELIDNNNMRSGVLASKIQYASHSKIKYSNEGSAKRYFGEFQQRSSQNNFGQNSTESEESENSGKKTNGYFYCNDLLVKEVLAAKEALKKCLTRSENDDEGERRQSRPRTVAEKKQGLSFSFKDIGKSPGKSEEARCNSNSNSDKAKAGRKSGNLEKKGLKSPRKLDAEEGEERCSKAKNYSAECPTASTCGDSSVPEPTTISLKACKKFSPATMNGASANVLETSNRRGNDAEESQKEEKCEKKTSKMTEDQKDNDSSNETKTKEDNMPLLVPEFSLNFDSSSDRDSSRSPPVITNQEEVEQDAKLADSKVISQTEKEEENKKHSYKDCEMTIADIITQLAYHEKATVRHKRYCNLCERWFPTTSRHRRHLAGYQHRYMELTQRKSIHALFILFTGKPCPRLLSANVIRSDCSIGELTPLQIAVQDVAKCVEYTQQNHKTKE